MPTWHLRNFTYSVTLAFLSRKETTAHVKKHGYTREICLLEGPRIRQEGFVRRDIEQLKKKYLDSIFDCKYKNIPLNITCLTTPFLRVGWTTGGALILTRKIWFLAYTKHDWMENTLIWWKPSKWKECSTYTARHVTTHWTENTFNWGNKQWCDLETECQWWMRYICVTRRDILVHTTVAGTFIISLGFVLLFEKLKFDVNNFCFWSIYELFYWHCFIMMFLILFMVE